MSPISVTSPNRVPHGRRLGTSLPEKCIAKSFDIPFVRLRLVTYTSVCFILSLRYYCSVRVIVLNRYIKHVFFNCVTKHKQIIRLAIPFWGGSRHSSCRRKYSYLSKAITTNFSDDGPPRC